MRRSTVLWWVLITSRNELMASLLVTALTRNDLRDLRKLPLIYCEEEHCSKTKWISSADFIIHNITFNCNVSPLFTFFLYSHWIAFNHLKGLRKWNSGTNSPCYTVAGWECVWRCDSKAGVELLFPALSHLQVWPSRTLIKTCAFRRGWTLPTN